MSNKQNLQYTVPYPDIKAFDKGVNSAVENVLKDAPQPTYMIEKVEYPEDGGIFVYHQDLLFPTKGFPFPEACEASNMVKRYFAGQIRLITKNWLFAASLLRKKNLDKWLWEFSQVSNMCMDRYYLKDIRYSKPCREISVFIQVFLKEMGYGTFAYDIARSFITMLEYDNAYLLRSQDLASETSSELLLKNPIKELKKLMVILKERDSKEHRAPLRAKFEALVFLASIVMWIPRVRRSFNKAMKAIDFSKIQLDEGDRYYVLRWIGYDFFGESYESRIERFKKLHNYIPPRQYILKFEQRPE